MKRGTYPRTAEIKRKNSVSNMGRVAAFKGHTHTAETKNKLSESAKRQWQEGRGVKALKGRKLSEGHKKNIGLGVKGKNAGEKHYNWKGGTKRVDDVYLGAKYADWRRRVFERDGFTCQICHRSRTRLQADHKLPKCLFPKSIFHLSNGRTLCDDCHKKTPTYGVNKAWMTLKLYGSSPNDWPSG